MRKIKRKLPKNIELLKMAELKRAIAEIITNPNKTWKNIKRTVHGTKILLPNQLNTKSKTIRLNRISFNSYVQLYCNLCRKTVEIQKRVGLM